MTMKRPGHRPGFTLIELIAVLMILGMLAGYGISRYADMQQNAESSALKGVMGSCISQCNIEHARLVLDPTLAAGGVSVDNIATLAGQNIAFDSSKYQTEFDADGSADTITITVAYAAGQGSATLAPMVWELP